MAFLALALLSLEDFAMSFSSEAPPFADQFDFFLFLARDFRPITR